MTAQTSVLRLKSAALHRRWMAVLATIPLSLSVHVDAASAFGQKSDICTAANNYCNGPPARSSSPSYSAPSHPRRSAPSRSRPVRRRPSRAEIERRRRAAEGLRLNKLGIQAWNREDWGAAVRYFNAALLNRPNDNVVRKNLSRAKFHLRLEQQKKEDAREAAHAKARIERMLRGMADEFARPGSGTGNVNLFDSSSGPEGFPTPTGRVGMIDVFDAPPVASTSGAVQPEGVGPTQVPAIGVEKPPLYSRGTRGSAPVVFDGKSLPKVSPGDFKGLGKQKGVNFKKVPPPQIKKPLFDKDGWRLDAKGRRMPGSRQIWSDKYKAYVDEFGRIRRNWPGPTKNPEGRLPNPLAEEQEKAMAADAEMIGKALQSAILNHERTRMWPGPTRPKQKSSAGR